MSKPRCFPSSTITSRPPGAVMVHKSETIACTCHVQPTAALRNMARAWHNVSLQRRRAQRETAHLSQRVGYAWQGWRGSAAGCDHLLGLVRGVGETRGGDDEVEPEWQPSE